jgi:hypothetical protein
MPERADDQIEEFLRSLPPAPESWVTRAEEIPRLELALVELREHPSGDDEAALRIALERAGLEPDERRIKALARLRDLRREAGAD